MARKVTLDDDCCVGCETCVELCPQVFEMDEATGKARVIEPEGGDDACVEEAIASCPGACIAWES